MDKVHPCFKPQVTANQSVLKPFSLTQHLMFLYNDNRALNMRPQIPRELKFSNNRFLFIASYAFRKSINARKVDCTVCLRVSMMDVKDSK